MNRWCVGIAVMWGLLSGCSDQEPFPVGIGSERNELKRSVCASKEQCKREAFYRHGRFNQK
jgi:hypothetical protein